MRDCAHQFVYRVQGRLVLLNVRNVLLRKCISESGFASQPAGFSSDHILFPGNNLQSSLHAEGLSPFGTALVCDISVFQVDLNLSSYWGHDICIIGTSSEMFKGCDS
jgi:hypothetical protein